MAKFIVRRLLGMLLTMLIVSIVIFLVSEIVPGDVSRHILGPFATPEQVEIFRAQLGLEEDADGDFHRAVGCDRCARTGYRGYPL